MVAQCVLGFLTLFQASGLSLPKGGHQLGACHGDDCLETAPTRNPSDVASSRFVCECCWRECDLSQTNIQGFVAQEGPGGDMYDAGQDKWSPGDRMDNIDAWIIVNGPAVKAWGVYLPIVETVRDAIESSGGVAAVIGTKISTQRSMVEGVKIAASQGRRPLVFTVAHEWWGHNLDMALGILKEAKDAGAYLVSYQAEPGFDVNGTAPGDKQKSTLDLAERMGADEVWEYTMANIKNYPSYPNRPIVRYVPPGYVRKLDVGVDINSKLVQAASIGYMGQTYHTTMNDNYLGLFGDRLNESSNIWTSDDLREFMERHPIQLNQHRWQTCCPREKWEAEFQHFETFRMASLLANKACVISGPSAKEDMEIWKGIVHFAEVEDTFSTFQRLSQNLQTCRLNSYETYKREFEPRAVLTRSGFFQVWRPPHGV